MNTTKTTTTAPLTEKEARTIGDLTQAVENYRSALRSLRANIDREEAGLTAGNRTLGCSNQNLIEAATYHKVLEAVLQTTWYAFDMDPKEWQALVNKVYAATERKWYREGDRVEVKIPATDD